VIDRPQSDREDSALELALLRALCADPAALSAKAWQDISAYRFSDPLHQVVFDALRRAKEASPTAVHAALLAELTRQGFPDVELDSFLSDGAAMPNDLMDTVRRLLRANESMETRPAAKPSKP